MRAGTLVPRWLRDEAEALVRPRAWVLGVLVVGSLTATGLLAFGPGDPAPAADGAIAVLLLEGVGLALLLTEGLVAADVRRGWAVLWLQKPVHPVGFYAARFLRAVSMLVILMLATAGVSALFFLLGRGTPRPPLEAVPVGLLLSLTLATVVFGLSSWKAHPDVLMALGFLFISTPLAAIATVQPEMFGVLSPVLRMAAPPVDAIIAAGGPWMGGPPTTASDVAHVAGYTGAWLLFALVGLGRTLREPFASER